MDKCRIHELLETNEELKKHDLLLTPSDADEIIVYYNNTFLEDPPKVKEYTAITSGW
jgi:hypothetical protein